jgi:hypothetical protein
MKRALGLLVATMICLQGLNVSAAEPNKKGISQSNLSAMGLPGLQVVSDKQGEKVRGMGNGVNGAGFAFSFFPGISFSHNNYVSSGALFSYGLNTSQAGAGFNGGAGLLGLGGGGLAGFGAVSGGFSTGAGF